MLLQLAVFVASPSSLRLHVALSAWSASECMHMASLDSADAGDVAQQAVAPGGCDVAHHAVTRRYSLQQQHVKALHAYSPSLSCSQQPHSNC